MFLTEFDAGEAIIEPGKTIAKLPGMPSACIGVFSHVIVEEWVEKYGGEQIAELNSAVGNRPIYRLCVDGFTFALSVPYLGGAAAAGGGLEELIAMGGRQFVYTGSCGVLRHDIADGHLIIPTAAIRDEGLSFHYVAPADEIAIEGRLVQLAKDTLDGLGLPFVEGKTWTTDAFYRETNGRMEKAKQMGAICVEMECASLAAVAQYRKVPFVQVLWSADNLDAPEWDKRGLATKGQSVAEKCMTAAIRLARRLAEAE